MKNNIMTLIAVALIAVTVILIVFNNKKNGGVRMITERKEYAADSIKELDVKVGACRVEIQEGDGFVVEGIEVVEGGFTYVLSGEKLTVTYEPKNVTEINLFGFRISSGKSNQEAKIILTVPKNVILDRVTMEYGAADINAESINTRDLSLTVGAGAMKIKQLFADTSAKINVGAGSLVINNAEVANVSIDCGVGETTLEGKITGRSKVKCGVGEVTLSVNGKESDYTGDLKCGLGEVKCGSEKISGSGSRTYGFSNAENILDVDCGVGEVTVKFN